MFEGLLEQIERLESLLKKDTDLSSIDFDDLRIKNITLQNHVKLINEYNRLVFLLKSKHAPERSYVITFFGALVAISTYSFVDLAQRCWSM